MIKCIWTAGSDTRHTRLCRNFIYQCRYTAFVLYTIRRLYLFVAFSYIYQHIWESSGDLVGAYICRFCVSNIDIGICVFVWCVCGGGEGQLIYMSCTTKEALCHDYLAYCSYLYCAQYCFIDLTPHYSTGRALIANFVVMP